MEDREIYKSEEISINNKILLGDNDIIKFEEVISTKNKLFLIFGGLNVPKTGNH